MRNLEIKKGRKFDQVVEGARTVFLRDGYEGASVDDIARESQVSKATLYSYFPDKRVLFIEIASREMKRQADEGAGSLDMTAPPEVLLPIVGRKLIDYMLSDFGLAIFRTAVAESDRFPEVGRKFYESGPMLVRDRITDYLETCIARGELLIDDVPLAAEQFAELCKVRSVLCCTFDMECDFNCAERDRIVASAVRMFMAAYRAP
ncbi:TetR/AcrR family transcriptional regulator [Celeribacter marinus]|uniref:TetR/AcrR family transcriptional regulator n=1 Tax=Celeribacter marinus TaxID=1397108 RepID=UPI0007860F03|nr:TetR/AcrR family transcriptional regulator [Celeribacter marinus]SFK22503.1 transcriptional regulator, TetR family [Celeribacter marinus]